MNHFGENHQQMRTSERSIIILFPDVSHFHRTGSCWARQKEAAWFPLQGILPPCTLILYQTQASCLTLHIPKHCNILYIT